MLSFLGRRSKSPIATSRSSSSPRRRRSSSVKGMRDRSGSLSLSPRAVIPLCPQLSPSQVMLIKKAWRHINTKGFVAVLARCFQRLESQCPVASHCFAMPITLTAIPSGRSISDHAKSLTTLMDGIVEGVRNSDDVREIGARHAGLKQEYGLSSTELDRLQEILVDVFLRQDGVRQSKETTKAWRILICTMADAFRNGFEAEVRLIRRKSSFNGQTQYFEDLERRASLCASLRKGSWNSDVRVSAGKMAAE